jgi:hypothetical protein
MTRARVDSRRFRAVVFAASLLAVLLAATAPAYAVGAPLTQISKLTASDETSDSRFGMSVAASGDTMVIGAYRGHGVQPDSGVAYVYTRSAVGAWSQTQKLVAPDGTTDEWFGSRVAISGDTVVVGAPWDTVAGPESGSAYVFARSPMGVWAYQQKLTGSSEATGDYFGNVVAVSGDTIVVGSPGDDPIVAAPGSGSAYVFTRSSGLWSEQRVLTSLDATANDTFGNAVAIDGDTIAVGAPGAGGSAYVFTRSAGAWPQQSKLRAFDAANWGFGNAIAIRGDTVVVGAGGSPNPGAAYVFTRSAGVWSEQRKLTSPDGAAEDGFGVAVDVLGDTIAVGAPWNDTAGTHAGSAYVFGRSAGVWSELGRATASDGAAYDVLGHSVALTGGTLVAGAVGRDSIVGESVGAAYVFSIKAPTSITIKTNATSSKMGGVPILSGLVTPTALVGQNIVVYVKKPGKSYWSYSSWRTAYSRYGIPSWQYKYYFKKGMTKGTYVYKAFVPTYAGLIASTSPTTVSIKLK